MIYADWAGDLGPAYAASASAAAEMEWLKRQHVFASESHGAWIQLRRGVEATRSDLGKLLRVTDSSRLVLTTGTLGGLSILAQARDRSNGWSPLAPGDEVLTTDGGSPFSTMCSARATVSPSPRCRPASMTRGWSRRCSID